MADGLDQALREEVAIKSDIAALRNELRGEIGALKSDLAVLGVGFGVLKNSAHSKVTWAADRLSAKSTGP